MSQILTSIKQSDFIAYDPSFLNIIGPSAQIEKIQSFSPSSQNVHEAPIYTSSTNELLYSDTSLTGILFAINIDTHAVREIHTSPPLQNVNGGTLHPTDGKIYVATNGGPVRGIYSVNITTGQAEVILNNYRGRHFNSPNDLIFDSQFNLYFTDPTYGYQHKWSGVQEPELPNAIYKFNTQTKAVTALSNALIGMPNGLALSADEKTLYVADSSSTSMQLASQRAVFAFGIKEGGLLGAPRLVYQLESGWPDGLRVTRSGLLVVAVSGAADIVDPEAGKLIGKVNTPDDVIFNVEPARGKGVWLLTGKKHIYKVTMREGPVDAAVRRRDLLKPVRDTLAFFGGT